MTRRWPVVGVVLAVLWLFVRGVARTPPVTVESFAVNVVEETVVGLGVGMAVAYYTREVYADRVPVSEGVRAAPYAVVYLLLFLKELVTANVEVAYRVLAPSLPIEPAVYELPLRVESDVAVTAIANSITLTPGTLTMDYDPERNALYVHALFGTDRESVVEPVRRWEDYALVIFDERRSPGDPVPGRTAGEPDEGDAGRGGEPS